MLPSELIFLLFKLSLLSCFIFSMCVVIWWVAYSTEIKIYEMFEEN